MISLRPADGRVLRVGHRGAAALAPANTIDSLAAALRHDVDLVEFDVSRGREGALTLAHSPGEETAASPPLDDALAFLAAHAPAAVGFVLDLKAAGAEADVVSALRRHRLLERTVVCSFFPRSLRALARLEPGLPTGLSYPLDRLGVGRRLVPRPAAAPLVAALRATLPARIGRMLARARAGAAMVNWTVVSPALVARCHARGAAVLAWTVEDAVALERVLAAGVDGVVVDDPRIFTRGRPDATD